MTLRRALFLGGKIGLAVVVGYVLLQKVDAWAVWLVLTGMSPRWLAVSLLIAVLAQIAGAMRWRNFLALVSLPIGLLAVLRMFFVSNFFGTLLPAGVGRDALRIFYAARAEPDKDRVWRRAAASVVLDRFVGSAVLLAACLPAAIRVLTGQAGGPQCDLIAWSPSQSQLLFALAIAGAVIVVLWLVRSRGRELLARLNVGVTRDLLIPSLGFAAASSGLIVALVVMSVFALGIGLGLSVPFSEYATFLPLIVFAAQLPISIMGLGVRETGFVLFFGCTMATREEALALSLAFLGSALLVNLLSAGFLLLSDRRTSRGEAGF